MGVGGIWQWVVVLLIILLLFGTKKLRNMGTDLGSAVKGFRKGMQADPEKLDADADAGTPAKGAAEPVQATSQSADKESKDSASGK